MTPLVEKVARALAATVYGAERGWEEWEHEAEAAIAVVLDEAGLAVLAQRLDENSGSNGDAAWDTAVEQAAAAVLRLGAGK